VGIYLLAQRAKEYVTVLLSGEGADEVWGGYSRFGDIKYQYDLGRIFQRMKHCPSDLIEYLSPDKPVLMQAFMPLSVAESVFGDFNYSKAIEHRKALYKTLTGSRFDKQVKYELKTYLPDLLVRQDKMSMAHSIENRVPFLDYNLVQMAFDVPEDYLCNKKVFNGAGGKLLLKEIAADIFGNDFAFRTKCGFGLPLHDFFINKKMNQYIKDDLLVSIKKRGLMNYKPIEKMIQCIPDMSSGELDCSLWIVLSFEIWAQQYLDTPQGFVYNGYNR
jgi:asparagine synthase (glutamine-hydrolysing)